MSKDTKNWRAAAKILKSGGAGVLPTDTLYGLVGSALSKKAVERIYKLRRRDLRKPMIILISGVSDIRNFGINIRMSDIQILKKIWPGPVSIIFPLHPAAVKRFRYLHRGKKTLAFRLPKKPTLCRLLKQTGPLIAPSANPEGLPPAQTAAQAKRYFGDQADFYLDGGRLAGLPSTLIEIRRWR